jgi:hypothetical protein
MNRCFQEVQQWFTLNWLSLNPDKSEAIVNQQHQRATANRGLYQQHFARRRPLTKDALGGRASSEMTKK